MVRWLLRRPRLLIGLLSTCLLIGLLTHLLERRLARPDPASVLPQVWMEPSTGIEMTLIRAGDHVVGSPSDEPDREAREVRHRVRLTRPFYVGTTEVTQAQWRSVMGSNPSRFQPPEFDACPDCPVENVNFWQAQEFLSRLSARGGHRFRLPTEAEWEVVCRAGSQTAFAFGDALSLKQANFDSDGESQLEFGRTSPVASYRPNAWGLFDLHGNVWEWTSDPLCPYGSGGGMTISEAASGRRLDLRTDPRPDCDSPWKVIRGGSFRFGADSARCALRYTHRPQDLGPSLGFRVVREISSAS